MTKDEVATLFRVGPDTVTRWVSAGTLKAVRVGGTLRFNRQYIRSVIESGESRDASA